MQNQTENLTNIITYNSKTGFLARSLVNENDQIRGNTGGIYIDPKLSESNVLVRVAEDANILEALEEMDLSSSLMDSIKGVMINLEG